MSAIDDLLAANGEYADEFPDADASACPTTGLAIVACMDARMDVARLLALHPGDAHVIRNAGGTVTDDVIRSLCVSQRLLGTTGVMVIQHTGCGMATFRDGELRDQIEAEVGVRPPFAFETFTDLEASVLRSLARLRATPFLAATTDVRGFIYDVDTGRLQEVVDLRDPRRQTVSAH